MPLLSPNHPGFFEVVSTPRAYTALLYMLLSLAIGVFTFTYTVTGLSLSLGLAILIIGIPIALAFLALLLGRFQVWLARNLLIRA